MPGRSRNSKVSLPGRGPGAADPDGLLDRAWRDYSRYVLATLVRLLRDFDLAEEAMHAAFLAAAQRWPRSGIPSNPTAWLVSAGRYSAIDKMRRRERFARAQPEIARELHGEGEDTSVDAFAIADDQLRLIFICCHPELPAQAQVALTLREVCGLTTEEIARAFLTRPPTIAQRIVRAKARLKDLGMPYEVPEKSELPGRIEAILRVVYLVFNEGYSASAGPELVRNELSGEAIRLGRLLVTLLPDPETRGLLAMMLFHEARRPARQTVDGDIVLMADQDRTLWDQALIAEGTRLVEQAGSQEVGVYWLQAAIAAIHVSAPDAAQVDWGQILTLYDLLLEVAPSPVVQLNRAVAIYMLKGPEAGLAELTDAMATGALDDYAHAFGARAEMLSRAGRINEARQAYQKALSISRQEPERRHLLGRLDDLGAPDEAGVAPGAEPGCKSLRQ